MGAPGAVAPPGGSGAAPGGTPAGHGGGAGAPGAHGAPIAPSPWVRRHCGLVPAGGAVLDLAAGRGRHTRLFLHRGHPVVAVDRDVSALEALRGEPRLEIVAADLEDGSPWPLPGRSFAGIVVTNYLNRPAFPHLLDSLEPGGALIYETFAVGNERFSSPRNPEFLLRENELLDLLGRRLVVLAFEHATIAEPRPAVVQRIAALRRRV